MAIGVTSGFRADIQGMRAIAVLLVLAYHVDPGIFPGGYVGVDVFFVISGYLITGLLVRELSRKSIDLRAFYARRIRRLLPVATLVLVAVLVATWGLLPPSAWGEIGSDVIAGALYVENWLLVSRSVDYLALDASPSPAQHFWSLSVEEQFYIFWPVMMLLSARVAVARGWPVGRALLLVLSGVSLVSLCYAIYASFVDPAPAYFMTATRIWELGVGGVLAIATSGSTAPTRSAGNVWGWGGVFAILLSAIFYTNRLPFPGYEALLPTLGAVAILFASPSGDSLLGRVLAQRWLQYFGGISYSLYLWHWPVVVFFEPLFGQRIDTIPAAVTAVALSVVLAHFSKILVEDRFRHPRPAEEMRPFLIGLALTGLTVACAVSLGFAAEKKIRDDLEAVAESSVRHVGAAWVDGDRGSDGLLDFIPEAGSARMDRGGAYGTNSSGNCIAGFEGADLSFCRYGEFGGSRHLVILGDSHAVHWLPALERIAALKGWRVTALTKSSCAITDVKTRLVVAGVEREYVECLEWARRAIEWVEVERPDALLVSQSPNHSLVGGTPHSSREAIADGLVRLLEGVRLAGIQVAVIKHTPWNPIDIPQCMIRSDGVAEECTGAVSAVLRTGALEVASKVEPSIRLINLDRYFCFDGECPVVIGGVLVYRDAHHLTATYARTMAEPLGRALESEFSSLR